MSTEPAAAAPPSSGDPPRDTLLASFLATRDVPCPNPRCGFNLHGLNQSACPECGEVLRLAVVRPEALWFMRRWVEIAATIFFCSVASEAAVWGWAILQSPGWRSTAWFAIFGMHSAIALGLGGALLWYAVRTRSPRALPRLLLSFLLALIIYSIGALLLTLARLL